jgi:hypothetical protein
MSPSTGTASHILGSAISGGGGSATFLLADATDIDDWAGDTNATSSDPYDTEGSDWHRVMLDALDDDVVQVDLGAGRHGIGLTVGETGWHTVFRTPTGLRMVTRIGGPANDTEYPTAAGSTERLLGTDAFWNHVAAPLARPIPAGTLRMHSGWLMIMSTLASSKGLHRDGTPIDLPALLADAENAGMDAVEVSDAAGGQALLVHVSVETLSVWYGPEHSDPALGRIDRCDLRFEH